MNIIDMDRAVIIADESPELFEDLFKMVIESLPEKYSNLETALENKDADQIEMYAHQFKGALRNLAAQDSVQLLQEIENQGAKGNHEKAKALYADLKPKVEKLQEFFEEGSWRTYFSR